MSDNHIILLGDSIFDNASYVKTGEPDVTEQVKSLLPGGSRVTRLALDGDVTAGVAHQMSRLPDDASHLFVSVGGNDALARIDILQKSVSTAGEALSELNSIREAFEERYSNMLDTVLKAELPTAICTIYYPRFNCRSLERMVNYFQVFSTNGSSAEELQNSAMSALAVYNDVIMKQAVERSLPIIDLRVLCNEDADFANPIEPSALGGMKIAETINWVAHHHDFHNENCAMYKRVERVSKEIAQAI